MAHLIPYETDEVQGVGVATTQQAQGQRGNLEHSGKIQLLTKIGILKDGVYASKVHFSAEKSLSGPYMPFGLFFKQCFGSVFF